MVVKEGIPSCLETGPDKSGSYKNIINAGNEDYLKWLDIACQ
jgi:hypothetical protein